MSKAQLRQTLLAICLITAPFTLLAQRQYHAADSLLVMQLITEGSRLSAGHNVFLWMVKQFIGRPYVAHTLDRNKEEKLVVNLREVDCTTVVEYALSAALCVKRQTLSFQDFCRYLQDVRYQGGKIDYAYRQHYFTLWIDDNTQDGFVREVPLPPAPFSAIQRLDIHYMTTHVPSYAMLKGRSDRIASIRKMEKNLTGRKCPYIPKAHLAETQRMRELVKDGDIIVIVTKKRGLDTSHLGVALWQNGELHLLNASQIHRKVVVEPLTLYQYMHKHPSQTGIRIVRVM